MVLNSQLTTKRKYRDMNEKEKKLNEVTRNFFEAVMQLMEEACDKINAINEEKDIDSVEETTVEETIVKRIRRGFYKTIWGLIFDYIPANALLTTEEILDLCWKYAPTETKEALEYYNTCLKANRHYQFAAFMCKMFIQNRCIIPTTRRGFYVRSDFLPTTVYPRRRSVNNTTSNVVINNSPVIKVINK